MLEMIKAKQKMQKERSEAELLDGIGDGILKDLESSLHEKQEETSPKIDDSRHAERMGDSTMDAFLPSQRSQNHRDESPRSTDAKREAKKVHFAPSTGRSNQIEQSGNNQAPKSSSESEEGGSSNKLAELNNLLKQKDFNFKEDDENEFEAFLKDLHKKRETLQHEQSKVTLQTMEPDQVEPIEAERFYPREDQDTPKKSDAVYDKEEKDEKEDASAELVRQNVEAGSVSSTEDKEA